MFTVPQYITVHLGQPDEEAPDVTVPFQEYLKNVSSRQFYPTWPENALRANILEKATFALNRIYNEYYRSRGYDFDITSSPAYDLDYRPNRFVYENISRLSDELFNNYISRGDSLSPIDTKICDSEMYDCKDIDRWGTVKLAYEGLMPLGILQYYYGEDINIVQNAPVGTIDISYPGSPLKPGSRGENVRIIQYMLNRISDNYSAIPKIPDINGTFDIATEAAVVKFQNQFSLPADGIIDEATWYRILDIYDSVKRLYDLISEKVTEQEAQNARAVILSIGDKSENVRTLQRYLALIGFFEDTYQDIIIDGIYGPETEEAVRLLQENNSLPVTGMVNAATWDILNESYNRILAAPIAERIVSSQIYPGISLSRGMQGPEVRDLQNHLQHAAQKNPLIPSVDVNGDFNSNTESSVKAVQRLHKIREDGVVDNITWSAVVHEAR